MSNIRSMKWVFTFNNYEQKDVEKLQSLDTQYIVFGYENAPQTGTPHLQGCLYFKTQRTFASLTKKIPGCWFEPMKGTVLEASNYCKKGGNFYENGIMPAAQGSRTDIEIVRDAIGEGKNMRQIIDISPSYQALKCAQVIFTYKEKARDFKPNVIWIYGDPGAGKSRYVYDKHSEVYRLSNMLWPWWEGYDGHEVVLIDDVKDTSDKMYSALLEILDRYECRVQVKGGSRQLLAKTIYLTSTYAR